MTTAAARSKRRLTAMLSGAMGLAMAAWAAGFIDGGFWQTTAVNLFTTVLVAAAGVCALHASRNAADGARRRAFLYLAAGVFAWGLGNVAWTYYDFVRQAPFPSVADVGYLAALPLFALCLLRWPKRRLRAVRPSALDMTLVIAVTTLFSVDFVIGPMLEAGLGSFAAWLSLAYPVADLALFTLVIGGLLLEWWEDRGRLALLAAGFMALVAADTGFALAGDAYTTGSLIDPLWLAAFTMLGAAALADHTPRRLRRPLRFQEGFAALVLVALLGAVLVNNIHERWDGLGALERAESAAGALLIVMLMMRHAVVARENLLKAGRLAVAQEELSQAYALRQGVLEASRTGLCLFDDEGPRLWNSAFVELIGIEPASGEAWQSFVGRLARTFGDHGGKRRSLPLGQEFRFWTSDDRFVALRLSPLEGNEMLVSADDVTEQERERTMQDRFVAEVVAAQEREARRIAELLHDDAVQQLTALGLRLELEARRSDDGRLTDLARTSSGITATLRRLVTELHPAVLETQGLAAAVAAAAESLRAQGVDVSVSPFDRRLPVEVEQLAYRLVQEALANVMKHADAARVDVEFGEVGGSLRCRVTDDGRGFNGETLETALAGGHLGLHLVRERVEAAGGLFMLNSEPGAGTWFVFELPVKRPSTPAASVGA